MCLTALLGTIPSAQADAVNNRVGMNVKLNEIIIIWLLITVCLCVNLDSVY